MRVAIVKEPPRGYEGAEFLGSSFSLSTIRQSSENPAVIVKDARIFQEHAGALKGRIDCLHGRRPLLRREGSLVTAMVSFLNIRPCWF